MNADRVLGLAKSPKTLRRWNHLNMLGDETRRRQRTTDNRSKCRYKIDQIIIGWSATIHQRNLCLDLFFPIFGTQRLFQRHIRFQLINSICDWEPFKFSLLTWVLDYHFIHFVWVLMLLFCASCVSLIFSWNSVLILLSRVAAFLLGFSLLLLFKLALFSPQDRRKRKILRSSNAPTLIRHGHHDEFATNDNIKTSVRNDKLFFRLWFNLLVGYETNMHFLLNTSLCWTAETS